DAEELLADLWRRPRRAADHLVIEDAAVDPAHEDKVADFRDVDAGGQQIHGDDVFRARVVAEDADLLRGPIDRRVAGDLLHQILRLRPVFGDESGAQFLDQYIRMVVARGEDQGFAGRVWRDLDGQRF